MSKPSTPVSSQTQSQTGTKNSGRPLFEGYAPPSAVYDEAVTAAGQPRPAWKELVDRLERMGEADLRKRWGQAQVQIERNGVTFNPHDDDGQGSRPMDVGRHSDGACRDGMD